MAEYSGPPDFPSGGLPSSAKGTGPACGRYSALRATRDAYLVRARRVAGLTIPSLFREEGAAGGDDTVTTWQSHGARCVNNLASKIVLALFPPARPFIRLEPSRQTLLAFNQMDPDTAGALKAEIDKGLGATEREFANCVEEDGDRATLFDAARHLIVGGNHGIQIYPGGSIRGFPLDSYVTMRDSQGTLLEWVICDNMMFAALPKDIQDMVATRGYDINPQTNPKQCIDVYTHGMLVEGRIEVYQEVYGLKVPGSDASYEPDYCPYQFLCMIRLKNEHYGRSYAEDYEGDLQALDSLTEIITTGSAAVARFIQLVRPGGRVSKKALQEARNGDVLTGQAEDVVTVQGNKEGDFGTAQKVLDGITERLTAAFLLNSSVQRSAERVTAEEIRYVAQELEDALGGVYANLTVTWQRPYGTVKLRICQKTGRVTKLPSGSVKITVIAGMAAIGRNDELAALDSFVQGATAQLGAQVMTQAINPRILLARRATALGIDTQGLIYSEEEASAQLQAQQQQLATQTFGPELVKQLGQYLTRSNAAAIAAAAPTQGAPAPAAPGQPPGSPPAGAGGPPQPGGANNPYAPLTSLLPSTAPQGTPQAQPSLPLS